MATAPKPPMLGPPPTSVPFDRPVGGRPPARPQIPKEVHPAWNAFMSQLYNVAKPLGGSDTTTNRPTAGLFVGYPFFDTTLGLPIWVQTLNPTVWVNATGAPV